VSRRRWDSAEPTPEQVWGRAQRARHIARYKENAVRKQAVADVRSSMSRASITIDGNVGRDPEVRFSKAGNTVVTFSVAVTERVKEGDGWKDGDTTWFRVTAFGQLGEDAAEGVRKGARVVVGGRFKVRKWTGDDGVERTEAEVVADWVGVKPRAKQDRGQASRDDIPF
jgi:single-strand DNA-binding protein